MCDLLLEKNAFIAQNFTGKKTTYWMCRNWSRIQMRRWAGKSSVNLRRPSRLKTVFDYSNSWIAGQWKFFHFNNRGIDKKRWRLVITNNCWKRSRDNCCARNCKLRSDYKSEKRNVTQKQCTAQRRGGGNRHDSRRQCDRLRLQRPQP